MGISVPGFHVNNVPIGIVPNSAKIVPGDGKMNVRAASVGDSSVEIVYTEDAESKIGQCKFEMYPTDDNISLVREWKRNKGSNYISYSQKDAKPASMSSAALVNDPEVELTADGTMSLEWMGSPWGNN